MKILVTGAGGFIGGHLVSSLAKQGHEIVAADIKNMSDWYQVDGGTNVKNIVADMSKEINCLNASEGVDQIYNLAADMGGIGFIENNKAECMLSVLINTHLLMAAKENDVQNFLFTSSACVYNGSKQSSADAVALKESDAYPADPEDGYGWEKLFSERMCRHFMEDYKISTRIARYHNVYGPYGTYFGGREKAPAAIARKVAEAKLSGNNEIVIWGDGEQTRSFMYVDDCVKATVGLMNSSMHEPVNVGSAELVTINQLVDIAEDIAGIKLNRIYDSSAPQGVRGRNSDNTLFRSVFDWEPSISLRVGMESTYSWIYDKMKAKAK